MSRGHRSAALAGFLAVVLMVAAACGDPADDQVALLTEDRPPPPATEAADEMLPADPATPPAAPTEPPPEPVPPLAESSESPAEPAPPPPAAVVEGPLDASTVAGLVAALGESQRAVTSERVQVYLSMQLSIEGVSAGSVSDVPFVLYTTSGDRTHVEVDQSALAALSSFEDGMPGAAPAGLLPIEMILDEAAQQAYVKLEPLAALETGEQPVWLQDVAASRGGSLAELWGRSSVAAADTALPVPVAAERPTLADFLALLQAASDSGSILEAAGDGSGEVAGVATQVYAFTIDLAALTADLPPFLASFLGGLEGGAPPPEEFLGALPPLPAAVTVHVDAAGFARQVQLDLDLGAILMAVFAGFGEMGEAPEGADIGLPEIEYLLSIRFETLAVNDPSLTVTLPDPSLVVDLP